MKTLQNKMGFTLIELMTVVVIIGIIAGLSLTSINGFKASSSLIESAQDLKYEITNASLMSVRGNKSHSVRFAAPDNTKYQLWTNVGMVPTLIKTFSLKNGTVFTSAASVIEFSTSGEVTISPGIITLKRGDRSKSISIMTATGEVIVR